MDTPVSHRPAAQLRADLEALRRQLEMLPADAGRPLADTLARLGEAAQSQEAQLLHYWTLFESEARPYLVTDDQGVILETNQVAASLLGVPQMMLAGKPLLEFVAPEMQPVFLMRLDRLRASSSSRQADTMTLDLTLIPCGGEPFPASLTARWLCLPDGQPIGWGWVVYDVTLHRLVEEALATSEARLTLALESAREGLFDYDVSSRQVYFSPTLYTSLGYSPGEFQSSLASLKRLIHPEDWTTAENVFGSNLAGKGDTTYIEIRTQAKSGEWRYMALRGKVIERDAAGRASRIVGTTHDISQRKHTEAEIRQLNAELELRVRDRTAELEEAIARLEGQVDRNRQVELELRAREEQYRTLVETSPDSIIVTDLDGTVLMVNTQTLTLFGYSDAREMVGQPALDFLVPADQQRALAQMELVLGSGLRHVDEYTACRKSGDSFEMEISVAPVRQANGVPIGLIFIARDVTERERMEAEVRRLNEVLEQRVTERTRELEALYRVMSLGGEPLDLPAILQQALALALETVGCQAGTVHLLDNGDGADDLDAPPARLLQLAACLGLPAGAADGLSTLPVGGSLIGRIVQQGRSMVSLDITAEAEALRLPALGGLHTCVGAPIRGRRRRIVGVLAVFSGGELKVSVEGVALLTTIADQMGNIVETARLRRQAELTAVMEERQRLARELHDSVTQALYSLTLLAAAGKNLVRSGNLARLDQHLATIDETAHQALRQMRMLIHALRPMVLEQVGLAEALRQRLSAVEERVGLRTTLAVEGAIAIPAPLESELYSMALETLNNALRHAQATRVTVRLAQSAGAIELEIGDDGRGFDPEQAALGGGLGLTSLRERAEKIGGELFIESASGQGSLVRVRVPYRG